MGYDAGGIVAVDTFAVVPFVRPREDRSYFQVFRFVTFRCLDIPHR